MGLAVREHVPPEAIAAPPPIHAAGLRGLVVLEDVVAMERVLRPMAVTEWAVVVMQGST